MSWKSTRTALLRNLLGVDDGWIGWFVYSWLQKMVGYCWVYPFGSGGRYGQKRASASLDQIKIRILGVFGSTLACIIIPEQKIYLASFGFGMLISRVYLIQQHSMQLSRTVPSEHCCLFVAPSICWMPDDTWQ
jgi:hypothetical protein